MVDSIFMRIIFKDFKQMWDLTEGFLEIIIFLKIENNCGT